MLARPVAFVLVVLVVAFAAACNDQQNARFTQLAKPRWADGAFELDFRKVNFQKQLAEIQPFPATFSGSGIAMAVEAEELNSALISLTKLRETGNTMPVEVFYRETAMPVDKLKVVEGVIVVASAARTAAALKVDAVLHSSFSEVLYMDATTSVTENPASLFESAEYKANGALFFAGLFKTAAANPIWSILDKACVDSFEQSAHVLVVNKQRTWSGLNAAAILASNHFLAHNHLDGAHDAFRLGFLATGTEYHMVDHAAQTVGHNMVIDGEYKFCAHSVSHKSPKGKVAFVTNSNSEVFPEFAKVARYNCHDVTGVHAEKVLPGFHASLLSLHAGLENMLSDMSPFAGACSAGYVYDEAALKAYLQTPAQLDYRVNMDEDLFPAVGKEKTFDLGVFNPTSAKARMSCNWNRPGCGKRDTDYAVRFFNVSTNYKRGLTTGGLWRVQSISCSTDVRCMKYGNETLIQVWRPNELSNSQCDSPSSVFTTLDTSVTVRQAANTWVYVGLAWETPVGYKHNDTLDSMKVTFIYLGSHAAGLSASFTLVAVLAFVCAFLIRY